MKICFVVEDIYPVIAGDTAVNIVNGRAVHMKNLAEGLRDAGHNISYVTMDFGQGEYRVINGCRIYGMYRPDEGIPGLRFLTVKIPKMYKALSAADADVYVFMCAEGLAGIVSLFCVKNRKKFFFYGGTDSDFGSNYREMNLRDRYLYSGAINSAAAILCQNNFQLKELMDNFEKKGDILYNPMDTAPYSYNVKGTVIWVANYSRVKRPEIFVALSDYIDDDLVMIGGCQGSMSLREYDRINCSAKERGIQVKGVLPFNEADVLISGSKLLVNTSSREGLSNTFLQAWRRGIPVVSFVDPDSIITDNFLGKKVGSFEELVEVVKIFSRGISEEKSLMIKKYFDRTFVTQKIIAEFEEILKRSVCDRL